LAVFHQYIRASCKSIASVNVFEFLSELLTKPEATNCLGLEWLGHCNYDPSLPSPTYFTLGNAIAALAFTLTVQTFLKPVYRFRLYARYLSLGRLYVTIFAAVFCCAVAAIVPSIHVLHNDPWGYAMVWEFLATALFVFAYGSVAIAVVRPIKVADHRVEDFAQGAARLLSAASQTDHIDILPDLERSLPKIIELARFVEREPQSAFFDFIHRKKIEQASYAYTFLGLIADPEFCRTLVTRAPWATANMLRGIGYYKLHARSAEKFVQEIAHQAILAEDSMLTRELDYHGFGTAPLLSESLFSDPFTVDHYDPLDMYVPNDQLTWGVLKRFNAAAERLYLTMIDAKHTGNASSAHSVHRFYRSAFSSAYLLQQDKDYDYKMVMEIQAGVMNAVKLANKLMASLGPKSYDMLYLYADENHPRHDVLESLVETVFEGLMGISNRFKGSDDPFWHLAIDLMHEGFNSRSEDPDGMTPFQQRLALKIIDKLEDNMRGYFPSVSKVMLATIGPFEGPTIHPTRNAFNILRLAAYAVLQNLPEMGEKDPEKAAKYLPDNIALDAAAGTITQTYSFRGEKVTTDLRALKLEPISLFVDIRRPMTAEEIQKAQYEYPDNRR
jgi:hypothetical protein